ncbi:MAG: T9SS type B sorting domain-containing protein [Bacteroidetes bacterium]|nr:T9SS type B sorting domain-containing protein [Bacteroidota bacterium]
MIRPFLCLIALLFIGTYMMSQVPPPNLFCASNQGDGRDTLRFDIPPVSCGSVDSLSIFQSDSPDGPFTLIQTTDNITATAVSISNPGNNPKYYHLRLIANCADSLSPPSDTLSNILPPIVPIQYVSVKDGETIIRWIDLSSQISKIRNYIIYRVDVGTEPIDTVPAPQDTFVDPNSSANLQSEFYYLQALDGCGLSGSLGNQPHNTIFLQDSIDPCGRRAILNWNEYGAWDSVAYYSLHVSQNSGPAIQIDSLHPSRQRAEIPNLDAQVEYTYYIEAHHPDSSYRARSNALTRTPDIRQGIRTLNFWGADVQDNAIEFQWEWNADAELVQAELINVEESTENIDLENQILNLQQKNTISFTSDLVNESPLSFFIETRDTCDSLYRSDTIRTAHLSAISLPSFENQIEINQPQLGSAVQASSCRLLRFRNNQVETSFPIGPTQSVFTDPFDALERPDDELCYQLECSGQIETLSGETRNIQFRSNIACPSREIRLQIPNALRPEGENQEFKPLILFENSISSYQMQIFDRWGRLLFETNEPKEGWRGQGNKQNLPAGVYVYRIHIEQRQGPPVTKKGTVTLIR